jgi:hypothetical protein
VRDTTGYAAPSWAIIDPAITRLAGETPLQTERRRRNPRSETLRQKDGTV